LVYDLVIPRSELEAAFRGELDFGATVERLLADRYWPVAFSMYFCDELLRTMFGTAAVQNAPPGSYPRYFQAAFERGLRAPGARANRFLHHALLGCYIDVPGGWPPYLEGAETAPASPEALHGGLADVPDLTRFDLLSLSNIADWMSPSEVHDLAQVLDERARSGAVLVARSLNNSRRLTDALGPRWCTDDDLAAELLARDQSLFYSRLTVARRA
jgi:S-adenosylmethionine-diacylglycerol 3-amino-3-carboxypropyl transferase